MFVSGKGLVIANAGCVRFGGSGKLFVDGKEVDISALKSVSADDKITYNITISDSTISSLVVDTPAPVGVTAVNCTIDHIKTTAGDVEATKVNTVTSVSGSIRCESIAGSASSVSGSIYADSIAGSATTMTGKRSQRPEMETESTSYTELHDVVVECPLSSSTTFIKRMRNY